MTILVIKSPPTQNFPAIKSPPKSRSCIYLCFIPSPQPSTQYDISLNQSILTLTNFTKMSFTPRWWIILGIKDPYRCIKKFPMLSKFLTVIRDLFFCSRYVTDDSRTLPLSGCRPGVDRVSTGCRLGVDWVSTGCTYTSQSPVFTSYSCTKMTDCQSALLKTLPLNHIHRLSVKTAHSAR